MELQRVRLGRGHVWIALVLVALIAASVTTYYLMRPAPKTDPIEVIRQNNIGIGYMERFEYANAADAFEKVVRMDPSWLPGRINLGIALLNKGGKAKSAKKEGGKATEADAGEADSDRATKIFKKILEEDPKNPYALYCLGVLAQDESRIEEATNYFEQVTKIDPKDPSAWLRLGQCWSEDQARALTCFEQALKFDPYNTAALYGKAMQVRLIPTNDAEQVKENLKRTQKLLDELQDLRQSLWENQASNKYSEMGRYAEVIGRQEAAPRRPPGPLPVFIPNDQLKVELASGARWATADDLGKDEAGQLRQALRKRFGGAIVLLDITNNDKLSLLLLGAVVENGKIRDLLLRNDDNGQFTDITKEAGLATGWPSIGCTVGDYDNDGFEDLLLTGVHGVKLFRNTGKGTFEDVTAKAGLDKLNAVCLSAAWLDLDQDGDLDLAIAQYANSAKEALALLQAGKLGPGPGLAVFLNVGESIAQVNPATEPPGLTTKFERVTKPEILGLPGLAISSICFSDLDCDLDLDLLALPEAGEPVMLANDRLLRFHKVELPTEPRPAGLWNGGLVLDANSDGRSDLFLLPANQPPVFLINQTKSDAPSFGKGTTNAPPLRHAHAVDIDLDGMPDVLGLSADGLPVLLHNDGERLVHERDKLGLDANWPKDLIALAVGDVRGAGWPDVLLWSESKGLIHLVNQGNGNHGLRVLPRGHRKVDPGGLSVRTNNDAVGTRITAQTANEQTGAEISTSTAGLGQSRQPVILGLGKNPQPDVVRLRWPDNVIQAEFNLTQGQVNRLHEANRKTTSCPILFAWNGERFVFATDFLGAGNMGELQPDGSTRPPRPEESVYLPTELLKPRDGHYVLKVAEPMDEVTYLDRLQLVVVDHPPDLLVVPDERFGGQPVTQDLLALGQPIFPVRARDHRGRDQTETLRAWDRRTVDGFAKRIWLGYAEEHWVELDFGDRLQRFGPQDKLILALAGWTDYAYPESIWAATQAGVALQAPVLERQATDGSWQPVLADMGFPAGLPRLMTVDLTGKLTGPRCVLRIRTNMHLYWDQIFVAPLVDRAAYASLERGVRGRFHAQCLDVADAVLATRGCAQEFSPDGRLPTIYDHDRLESAPAVGLSGFLTGTGDVTELLRGFDDRYVIFGPGDEVTARFDARKLPPLPTGWKRSFVLQSWGYCKDSGPFTAAGTTIEPLPFRAMKAYPYGPEQRYPEDAEHEAYRKKYNTRRVGMRR